MTLKATPKPKTRPKGNLIKRAVLAAEAALRWRDVTSYFNTLDAETDGLNALANQVRAHLKPKDVFERMWCDDIITLSWQAHQLRNIKGYIIFEGARDVVSERIKMVSRRDDSEKYYREADYDVIAKMYIHKQPLGDYMSEALANSGMLLNHRFQMGYLARADDLEHIDRLIFVHEKRRDDLIDRFESRRG